MKRVKNSTFILISIFILCLFIFLVDNQQKRNKFLHKRSLSSLSSNCLESIENIFPSAKKHWNKFNDMFIFYKSVEFSYESYENFKKLYLDNNLDLELIERSPESLMAYLEAISIKAKTHQNFNIKYMSKGQRREILSLIESIDIESEESLKLFIASIYQTVLGKKYQFINIRNSPSTFQNIAYRIIQEDLSRHGLSIMKTKYKLFENQKSFLKNVINSKSTRARVRKIIYLPSLMGYLPPIKAFSIPDKYLNEVMSNGMSEVIYNQIVSDLNKQGLLSFNNTIRYNVFRRYFNIGISLIWSYVTLNALIEKDGALNDEKKLLDHSLLEMTKNIENASKVKDEINLELKEFEGLNENISRICRRLNRCIKYAEDSLGKVLSANDPSYLDCKSRRDPENTCLN